MEVAGGLEEEGEDGFNDSILDSAAGGVVTIFVWSGVISVGGGGGKKRWHIAQICSTTSLLVPFSNPVSEIFGR